MQRLIPEDAVRDEGFSVLVTDALGFVQFASGIATESSVREVVIDKSRDCENSLSTMAIGHESLFVVVRKTEEAHVYFIHRGDVDGSLIDFISNVPFATAILKHFITSPFAAMTVIDAKGELRFMSPVHESFFGLKRGESVGKKVADIIENTRLPEVVATGRAEVAQVQTMKGVNRVVTRVPISEDGRVVGAIGQVMFKEPQQFVELSRGLMPPLSEFGRYRREVREPRLPSSSLDEIVGRSDAVEKLKSNIRRLAPLKVPILLQGESGTGKELVAQAIHRLSAKRERNMVLVNAAALPATLVESELFGYEPGSFTGAEKRGRTGKFEQAHNSTLFLDEIGDMPIETQAKLLRVLDDGCFERIGSDKMRRSNFRLISATNRDVENAITEHNFRLDLYYRISAVVLRLPPLRERREDIPLLIRHFVDIYNRRHRLDFCVDDDVFEFLAQENWPGNVRQLQHEVERAMIFANDRRLKSENFFNGRTPLQAALIPQPEPGDSMHKAVGNVERALIVKAMERFKGNKRRVATALGISRSHLYKKLDQIGSEASLICAINE